MALREGGMIIEAWPTALVVSAAINVSRMARAQALLAMRDATSTRSRGASCTMASAELTVTAVGAAPLPLRNVN